MKRPQRLLPLLFIPLLLSPLTAGAQEGAEADTFTQPNSPQTNNDTSGPILTQTWKVDKDFFVSAQEDGIGALQMLKDCGVIFPKGTSATYEPKTEKLTVKNVKAQLAVVDKAVTKYQELVQKAKLDKLPKLWQCTWKIPRDYFGTDMLKFDPEIFLDETLGFDFSGPKGCCAMFKGGKLTFIHLKEDVERLDGLLEPDECKIVRLGEMKEVPPEMIERLQKRKKKKPSKKKMRFVSDDYDVTIDVEEYYKKREEKEKEYMDSE